MSNLRSQFKATSIKSLRKAVDKDDALVGVQNNDYLSLEDGKTSKIRIFPAHPGQDNFYISRMCYWMSFTTDEGETRRGTVLDSIAHGGTKMDIVREYVKLAKKRYGDDSEKMDSLVGTGMNSNSLNPRYSWLCYADFVREGEELRPKLWEFGKMVRDLLNKLAMSEDEDEPIEIDPFTDPDEGVPVLVKYLKKPNKKKGEQYYEVSLGKKPKARPITDEELEHFAVLKPLSEINPRYGMRDFDRALDGLRNFDEENGFDLFDDDEWLEIMEQVKSQYDSDTDEDDEKPAKKKTTKKVSKKVEVNSDDTDDDEEEEKSAPKKNKKKPEPEEEDEEEPEDEGEDDSDTDEDDEFTDMDRTSLKKYIKENGLDIVVKKSMSDDDLRDAIREAVAAEGEDDSDTDEDDEDDEEKPKGKISLDDIRKKLAGKK